MNEWPTACLETFSFYLAYFGVEHTRANGTLMVPDDRNPCNNIYVHYDLCAHKGNVAGLLLYVTYAVPRYTVIQEGLELA